MSSPTSLTPLAPAHGVDVDKIEQELELLWRDAESATQPVTRATAFNLILVCDREHQSTARELIPDLALVHPTRTMLVVLDESAPDAQRAWVTAYCRKLAGENRQICSEAIILELDGQAELRAASLLHSLALGSLATAVIWHDPLPLAHPLLQSLTRSSDRIITNAAQHLAPASALKPWFELYESAPQECVVTDLLWAELSGFRGAVAELFDECPSCSELAEIRVQSRGEKLTTGALLTGAWLASTLDWQLRGVSLLGKRPLLEFDKDRRLLFHPEGPAAAPGIEFLFRDGQTAAVIREANLFALTCGARKHIARAREAGLLELLSHELHAWGRDPRLDHSVRMAADWLPELLFA